MLRWGGAVVFVKMMEAPVDWDARTGLMAMERAKSGVRMQGGSSK